ncbi:MAG: alkaline phosphatase family protein [Firmicutes bacterium]|nr:alkaline phosphatase family protein [Bacillota bacterium]
MSKGEKNFVPPDYNNCLINVLASVSRHSGIDTGHAGLPEIDAVLKRKPKNVVVIVLDGLGSNVLKKTLPERSFLRAGHIRNLKSVFPSATTPAMISYITGQTPLEHGWLARNAYFKEAGAVVSLFNNTDAFSLKMVGKNVDVANSVMPHKSLLQEIFDASKGRIRTYTVNPPHTRGPYEHTQLVYNDLEEMMSLISVLCETPERKVVFAYHHEPDGVLHDYGTNSKYAIDVVSNINNRLEKLVSGVKDTLFIITADHGSTNITKHIDLSGYKELNELLIMPPTMEERMTSFFVQAGKGLQFREAFNKLFEHKFLLLAKHELLELGWLGTGKPHQKTEELLGDFIAIGIADWDLTYSTIHDLYEQDKKANHGGLTAEEMIIPLIIVDKK